MPFLLDASGNRSKAPPHDRPLVRRNAAGQLADRLVAAIRLGSYLPGQKFPPERELAQSLGVSRATVRDAMHQLAAMGYITIRRGRHGGATINPADDLRSSDHAGRALLSQWEELEWTFELSHDLYPLIARRAAERRLPADIERIYQATEFYARSGDDRDAMRRADHDVHTAIAQATHNPFYVGIDGQMRRRLSLGTDALAYSAEIRERALRDHRAIADAIAEADADKAAHLVRAHFVDLAEKPLRSLLRQIKQTATEDTKGAEN